MQKIFAYFWAPSGIDGFKHHVKEILIAYTILGILTVIEVFSFRELYILLILITLLQFCGGFIARRMFGDTPPEGSKYQ